MDQESLSIHRRGGAGRFSMTGFLKTTFRCVLLPAAWFATAGTGSYFFICGSTATCGTDVQHGRFDAAPMSRWLLALMAAVSGLLIVPLAFTLPCAVEVVLGRLMRQATMGRKQRPVTDYSTSASGSSAVTSQPGGGGGVSGFGTLTSDAMGPAIGGGSFSHDQWFLGGGAGDQDLGPTHNKADQEGLSCWTWCTERGTVWLYRAYCVFITLFGIVAAVQVMAELLTGNIFQIPR